MFETVQQYIIMYAPTVLMAISTIASYLSTFKALKTNVKSMTDNSTIKGLTSDMDENRALLRQVLEDNAELKRLNKELINELSRVRKYEDVSTNKEV